MSPDSGLPHEIRTPGYSYSLQLDPWNPELLAATIRRLRGEHSEPGERASAWCQLLLNTPFEFETKLAQLDDNLVRVRFTSFDCITFVYTVVALANAKDFEDFLARLYRVRYYEATLIDFACEALLFNCMDQGLLVDVTAEVVAPTHLLELNMELIPIERPAEHDPDRARVFPRYPNRRMTTSIALAAGLGERIPGVRSGDIVMFTKGVRKPTGEPHPTLASHAAFAIVDANGCVGFIHATRSYHLDPAKVLPANVRCLPGHPEKKLPGVVPGCSYIGDDKTVEFGSMKYFGYDRSKARSLASYAAENFLGVKFLRPV
jgi:hypothetical protein